ncbi:MAG: hypothetical protein EA424_27610 [Planctomycetaceae bacterium]|nr:MAG: hypothetical protein EA424_27610 [Planctomycetaceae bacterium]
MSSVDVATRTRLAETLEHIRSGDTLVVTGDQARPPGKSVRHLFEITETLDQEGAALLA